MSQRWVKTPEGDYVDANRVLFVSKVEVLPDMSGDPDLEAESQYTVAIGTGLEHSAQKRYTGGKETILGFAKALVQGTQ